MDTKIPGTLPCLSRGRFFACYTVMTLIPLNKSETGKLCLQTQERFRVPDTHGRMPMGSGFCAGFPAGVTTLDVLTESQLHSCKSGEGGAQGMGWEMFRA